MLNAVKNTLIQQKSESSPTICSFSSPQLPNALYQGPMSWGNGAEHRGHEIAVLSHNHASFLTAPACQSLWLHWTAASERGSYKKDRACVYVLTEAGNIRWVRRCHLRQVMEVFTAHCEGHSLRTAVEMGGKDAPWHSVWGDGYSTVCIWCEYVLTSNLCQHRYK